MNNILKKCLRPALFVAGGMLVGFLYYQFIGCASGSCSITSNPIMSTLYMGVVGGLLSVVFKRRKA